MKKLRLFDSLKFVRFVVAVIAATLILNIAHAATLPAGYTELEYIESTGTQYIDTGITDIVNLKTELVAQLTSIQTTGFPTLIGAGLSSSSDYYKVILGYHGTQFYSQSGNGSGYKYFGNLDTNKHTFIVDNGTDSQTITMDGTIYTSNYAITTNQTVPLAIFARKTAGSVGSSTNMKVWSVKFWHNGVLIQNLVPARRDSDGVLGMYDLADANPATAFHTNAGTGTFIAGEYPIKIATTHYNETKFAPVKTDLSAAVNAVEYVVSNTMTQAQQIDQIATTKQTRPDEGCPAKYCLLVEDEDGTPHWYPIAGANGVAHALPAGYTELQYTYMTGGSYLLTDIVPHYDEKIEMDFATTSLNSQGYVFLGGRSAPDAGSGIQFYCNSTNTFIADGFGTRYTSSVTAVANTRYKYTYNNQIATLESGGSTLFTKTYTTSGANTAVLALNAMNNNGSIQGNTVGIYLYSFKVWNAQGELVANYIPAKQTNPLTVGFYDTVSETFKTATAGTFTAGPDM